VTGDHLPIRGLRYPDFLLARAILMASAPYLVRLLGCTAGYRGYCSRPLWDRVLLNLLARQFVSAVPSSTSWVQRKP